MGNDDEFREPNKENKRNRRRHHQARRRLSSSSSSSLSNDNDYHRRRHDSRRHSRRQDHDEKRDNDARTLPQMTPPAPSDWKELRSHFQFVLPDETSDCEIADAAVDAAVRNDDSGAGNAGAAAARKKYGSTWQERMVQTYHSGLYKEYVLADLSRASSTNGGVGLRWRTYPEVVNGRGFKTCGNLTCPATAGAGKGGKFGIVGPPSDDTKRAIESYLRSCHKERQKLGKRRRERHRKRRKAERDLIEHMEGREQRRLSRLIHGIGLHDYEVDFAYVEQNTKKRELVKVRLCLRCAPALFASASSRNSDNTASNTIDLHGSKRDVKNEEKEQDERGTSKRTKGPATKAREAREKAAHENALLSITSKKPVNLSRITDHDDPPSKVTISRNNSIERKKGTKKPYADPSTRVKEEYVGDKYRHESVTQYVSKQERENKTGSIHFVNHVNDDDQQHCQKNGKNASKKRRPSARRSRSSSSSSSSSSYCSSYSSSNSSNHYSSNSSASSSFISSKEDNKKHHRTDKLGRHGKSTKRRYYGRQRKDNKWHH